MQTATRGDTLTGGYAPLREYAAIGDGRTLALARDGAIDWMCTPEFDGPSIFAALLDARRGGALILRPLEGYVAEQRYLDDTNVLETTFTTSLGVLRVTDAMEMDDRRDAPFAPSSGASNASPAPSRSRGASRRASATAGSLPTWR